MYKVSDEIMCIARIDIDQRENAMWSALSERQGHTQVHTSQLWADTIDERTKCIEKPFKYLSTTSSGPNIKHPCGLFWVPTKNRVAPAPCPRPDGGELQYVDQPLCQANPTLYVNNCSNKYK